MSIPMEIISNILSANFGDSFQGNFTSYEVRRLDTNAGYSIIFFESKRVNKIIGTIIKDNEWEIAESAEMKIPVNLEKPEIVLAAEKSGNASIQLVWKPCRI